MSKELSTEELAEMRATAEAATQDEWHVFRAGVDTHNGTFVSSKSEAGRKDAEHIATFDPPTVLKLLDALAAKDAEIARLREVENYLDELEGK